MVSWPSFLKTKHQFTLASAIEVKNGGFFRGTKVKQTKKGEGNGEFGKKGKKRREPQFGEI